MLKEQNENVANLIDPKFQTYIAAAITCALIGGAIGFAAGYGMQTGTVSSVVANSTGLTHALPASDKPSSPAATPPTPTWEIAETKSPVDDSPSITLHIATSKPTSNSFGLKTDSELVIRCSEHQTALYITLDEFLGSESSRVIYRIDNQPSRTGSWLHSTDGKAVFAPNAVSLARELASANMVFARISDFQGTSYDLEFKTAGLNALLPKVATACKWNT